MVIPIKDAEEARLHAEQMASDLRLYHGGSPSIPPSAIEEARRVYRGRVEAQHHGLFDQALHGPPSRPRGASPILLVGLAIALVALAAWFFSRH